MDRVDLERRALATELRLLEPICEFVRREDHFVYRSESFPTFYGGNGIELLEPGSRRLDDWQRLFHQEFPRDRNEHETFTFRWSRATEPLLDSARAGGYHVDLGQYMARVTVPESGRPGGRPSDGVSILRVPGAADWDRMEAFHRRMARGEDWDRPADGPSSLVAKTRAIAEAIDVEWYLLVGQDAEMPLARAGIFFHEGVGRLQDVATHPDHRRRGYATRLLRHLLDRAFREVGVDAVCLCADEAPPALALYRGLGFEPLARHVTLMRYPVAD